MRQAHENSAVEQWRNYLDPSAIITRELGYQRVDTDTRASVEFIKFMGKFESKRLSAKRLFEAGVPFKAALRMLKMPPERK